MSTINPHHNSGQVRRPSGAKPKGNLANQPQTPPSSDSFTATTAESSPSLLDMKSVPTWKEGAVGATPEQRAEFSKQIPEWDMVKVDGTDALRREYPMKKYSQGVEFTKKMMGLAKTERHHPKISLEWGKVTVEYHTHDLGGLHMNDFIGAAKADQFLLADTANPAAKKSKAKAEAPQTLAAPVETKPGLLGMKSVPTWKDGAVGATPQQKAEFSKQIPKWNMVKVDGTDALRREYPMKKYSQGVEFTEKMMGLAKSERHHPKIDLEWGKVTVEYHTHDLGGLHTNDFIGAAKADQLATS